MSELSPILALPYIQPAQAQKHVTHNEAIRLLDLLVQLTVADRTRTAPPATPATGDRHIVAVGATGDWAGQAGRIALREADAWAFFAPQAGWRAQVLAENAEVVFDGAAWLAAAGGAAPSQVPQLGVNTPADAVNRLAVSSAATLLTHDGAGHQVKINKFSAGDTGSLLYQTNWSGRAEIGLAGSDDLTVKVSADGASFTEALQVAAATGAVRMPVGTLIADGTQAAPGLRFGADTDTGLRRAANNQIGLVTGGVQRAVLSTTGFQIDLPLTGAAVQATSHDATAGRLARNFATGGIFGWGVAQGGSLGAAVADANAVTVSGLYATGIGTTNLPVAQAGLLEVFAGSGGDALHQRWTANSDGGNVRSWQRRSLGGLWEGWALIHNQSTILGPVSTVAGQPSGAVIERGANANGEYVRFADGTQICTVTGLSAANVSTALGSLFRSANIGWTYPVAFVAAPVVTGQADDGDAWMTAAAPGASAVTLRLVSAVTKAGATGLRAMATGRWL